MLVVRKKKSMKNFTERLFHVRVDKGMQGKKRERYEHG